MLNVQFSVLTIKIKLQYNFTLKYCIKERKSHGLFMSIFFPHASREQNVNVHFNFV